MPIFEFQCSQCGHIYEDLVMSGYEEDLQCPKCHSKKVNRLISRTGSIKKSGSGSRSSSVSSCGASGFS